MSPEFTGESGLSVHLWDGKTLSEFVKKKHGVSLGVRQCQRLFHQLDFRLRKPRPLIARADPILQQTHKKTQGFDERSRVRFFLGGGFSDLRSGG